MAELDVAPIIPDVCVSPIFFRSANSFSRMDFWSYSLAIRTQLLQKE